jgi:citrate lyase beta subunit
MEDDLISRNGDSALAQAVDAHRAWAHANLGDPPLRQPVHTVYGGADLFRADTARRLGELALRSLQTFAPDAPSLAAAIGLEPGFAERIRERVVAKLEAEPVEDFRIDFEDGFGNRSDEEEDATAQAAGREVSLGLREATLPPFVGLRIKPLTTDHAARAGRTLELFLAALLDATGGRLPDPLLVTVPKVVVREQMSAVADLLDGIEGRAGLPAGSVRMELMVETPASIRGLDGSCPLPAFIAAARGRCAAAHFGVYDYTASLGITAFHQDLDHPACDFARHVMQVALSGSGVWLSDGATNVMPAPPHRAVQGRGLTAQQEAENRAAVHHGWALHYRHVRHSLRHGYFQGWDLHPAQLPTRYAAVFAFYLEALEPATERLRRFVDRAARATLTGDVFDDAATGQALLNFFLRGLGCGAITEEEALATGLTIEELRTRSFLAILRKRGA